MELAESYVLSECLKIKSLCESLGTCVAEVTEETVSGAFQYNKTGTPLYLSYSGLRNVLRTLRPAETDPHYAGDGGKGADAPRRALLVNSYVDSALSSPGAADCASCVAVGLESARVLALKSQAEGGLRYKVGFLFNGGEEIYMNAVHGFVQARGRAQYLREYAAFVNLEATGSYGPDVVFRANSEVLLGSYVKRAPRPRATVIAQDIFGSGAVPSDTDYSVLGGQNFGQLTGMDLATMLDSRSYHCDRDTYDRIERGSIQAYGENLMAVIEEASLRLRRAEEKGREEVDRVGDLVYFDLFATYIVSYPMTLARIFHVLPFALALIGCAAHVLRSVSGGNRTMGGALRTLGALLVGAIACGASFALALALPALVGFLASVPKGDLPADAMVWYGRPSVAALLLIPPALAGLLLPYVLCFCSPRGGGKMEWDAFLSACHASVFVFAALGALITLATEGFRHSGYLFVLWSTATLVWLLVTKEKGGGPGFDGLAFGLHALPLSSAANVCVFAWLFFLDKQGLMGGGGGQPDEGLGAFLLGLAKADITMGVITGGGVIVCAAPLVPFALAALPRRRERARAIAFLLGSSLLAYGGFYFVPRFLSGDNHQLAFSPADPKRVFVMHAREMRETLWGYGPLAKEEEQGESWVFLGTDAAPLRPSVLDDAFGSFTAERPSPRRMLPYFPKTKKMRDAWEYREENRAASEGVWGAMGRFLGALTLDQPELPKLRYWRRGRQCHVSVETP